MTAKLPTRVQQEIDSHIKGIVKAATESYPEGADTAIADIPGAWDIIAIVSERHGYDHITLLQLGVSPGTIVMGRGRNFEQSIRDASAKATDSEHKSRAVLPSIRKVIEMAEDIRHGKVEGVAPDSIPEPLDKAIYDMKFATRIGDTLLKERDRFPDDW